MFVSFLIFVEGKDLFIFKFCYRYCNRWTAENETITYFFILFLNFVSVFHFIPSILSFISTRISDCYPLFNFLADICLEKTKKHETLNAVVPRTNMHFR